MVQITKEAVLKATKLYVAAKEGNARAQFAVCESISQGDFPTLIAPAIRRTLLAELQEQPSVVERWTSRHTVRNLEVDEEFNTYGFNQDNIAAQNMGDDFIPGTLPNITNREKYPQLGLQASGKTLRASQFGEAFGIDWQAILSARGTNINLIDDAVKAFAQHAKNHEDATPVKNLITKTGINTAKLGTAGAIAGNPAADDLLVLQAAIAKAQTFQIDGVDVYFEKFALLAAPDQVPGIRQALSSRRITKVPPRTGTGSGQTSVELEQIVDLGADLDIVPQRWLRAINPTLGRAWFLIPVGAPRPVITRNYLEGYETPGFWVKDGNARNYNGGEVPFLDGDFDSDAIQTKVRWAYGSNVMWNQGIVFSDGSGT